MAGLLDLPDEVILAIVDYLQMDTKQVQLPFYELRHAYRYAGAYCKSCPMVLAFWGYET